MVEIWKNFMLQKLFLNTTALGRDNLENAGRLPGLLMLFFQLASVAMDLSSSFIYLPQIKGYY